MRSVRMGTTRAQRKLFFRLNREKRELELQGYEVEPRDQVAAPGADAETQVGDSELHEVFQERIERFAEKLGARDLQILRERILAEEPRTLAHMGEEFGISRERVRQLEARLVRSLREHMKEHLVDFEYYGPPRED